MSNDPNTGSVSTVKCTAYPCEQIKRQSNNWHIVWSDGPGGMFHSVDYTEGMLRVIGDQARVVCGPACAQRLYEKYLSGKSI